MKQTAMPFLANYGGEELPAGTFHGKHCTNCGGHITTPSSFRKCPMCLHR